MTAATTFEAQLVNLQMPVGAQPDAQTLNENLGKLTAVIEEAQLSIGFGSANQFRSQLSSAIGAVDGAVSSVSAQIS
jgi:methylphosphotriester-DNA--protein-cysteine methyltransferase